MNGDWAYLVGQVDDLELVSGALEEVQAEQRRRDAFAILAWTESPVIVRNCTAAERLGARMAAVLLYDNAVREYFGERRPA